MPADYTRGKIYTLENNVNKTLYVGSTTQVRLSTRFCTHRRDAHNVALKSPLYVAIREIGIANFIMVEHHKFPCTSRDELEAEEYKLLKEYMKAGTSVYNVVTSKYGRKVSDETRLKISEAQLGKALSEETKMKMSVARKGKTGLRCPLFAHGCVRHKVGVNVDAWVLSWVPVTKTSVCRSCSCIKYGFWNAKFRAEEERKKTYPEWFKPVEEEVIDDFMNIDID